MSPAYMATLATHALAATILLCASGCRSRFVQATIDNESGGPVKTVELDYPGASFGVTTLAPHATYSYRFKALGSGPLTLTFNEANGAAHTTTGPVLQEEQSGSLTVVIGEHGTVRWQPAFKQQ